MKYDSSKCYYCGAKLTTEEYEFWATDESLKCCSGTDCCCMGMPTEPQICESCMADEHKKVFNKYKKEGWNNG